MDYLKNLENKKSSEEENDGLRLKYSFTPQPSLRRYSQLEMEIDSIFKNQSEISKTKLFGICGGTSCGKSKITAYLGSKIGKSVIICEKDFLKEKKPRKKSFDDIESQFAISNEDDGWSVQRKERLINFSDPDCYDWDKFIDVLEKLKNDEPATWTFLKFDDSEHKHTEKEVTINPKNTSVIFVEGMFLFKIKKLRDLLDFKIFVEVDEDIRLSRMVLYENLYMKSNPPALKAFFIIYEKFIKKFYEQNVEPSKKHSNLILPNFSITPNDEIQEDPSLEFLLINLKNSIRLI